MVKVNSKIKRLRDYSYRQFYDGFALGVATSTMGAAIVDLEDNAIDRPYLIGIPLLLSIGFGIYNRIRHSEDNGLSELEKMFE